MKVAAVGMGCDQDISELREPVHVVLHRPLLAVQSRWMGHRDVIVVEGVVVGHFPVASQAASDLVHLLHGACPQVHDVLMHLFQLSRQRSRFFAERHPDQRAIDKTGEGCEGPVPALKRLRQVLFPGCRQQLSLEVVGPAVIRADQTPTGQAVVALVLKRHASVGTTVQERPRFSVSRSCQQQRPTQQIDGLALTRGKLRCGCDGMPVGPRIGAAVPAMNIRFGVEPGGKKALTGVGLHQRNVGSSCLRLADRLRRSC